MLFKTTYQAPRKWVLVQVQLEQQEQHLRYVVVNKQPAEADSVLWTMVENTEELIKKAGKNLPYVIHFSGFGVLSRITENVSNYRESLLVSGGEDDFYFSSYELKSTVGVSFIRRSLVERLLEALTIQKVFVWGVHTGPAPLICLLTENGRLQLDFVIELTNGDLKKLERNTEDIKRLATNSGFLDTDAAYVRALQKLTNTPNEHYRQGLDDERFAQTKANYKEFVRFVKLGIGILAFFLLALVANYFYVNHLNNVAAQLESDIAGYGDNLALSDRLQQEKQRKLVLVENSGIQSAKYISFYLDEVGASVPAAIQLSSLETFPLLEPLKPKRKVELNSKHLTISGFSGSSKVLDDWMEALERKEWISGVELINYVRINDQKATFQLLVKISE
ncbi:MAG TPA: PilN domain-containing protein [Fluviicola sp.]|nr:PilN domain-containing protein [Fluviicola sp.]